MTAKIKLNAASGGGSFSLQAPSSSANNRVFTLPDSADATLLTSTASLGKILQVQQTVGTGTYSTSSQTFSDTVTCAITPSATTSKIICIYKIGLTANNGGYSAAARLVRDSTAIYVGAAASNRVQASSHHTAASDGIGQVKIEDQGGTFMDSPSTTSAITYRLQFRSDYSGQTIYAGRSAADDDATYRSRIPTSLLLMEVSA
jgi:hypothetical protein